MQDTTLRPTLIVVGAGTSGLGAALALARAGFVVRVLDKDPAPPVFEGPLDDTAQDRAEGEPSPTDLSSSKVGPAAAAAMDELFDHWRRPGVAQLRHSHVFLARLHNLIRDEYPELLRRLLAAGCRELRFADGLPPNLKKDYVPAPEDDDFTMLSSRRTTLEYVMRRYVAECTDVVFETETRVKGLVLEPGENGVPRVTGLEVEAVHHRTADGEFEADSGSLRDQDDAGESNAHQPAAGPATSTNGSRVLKADAVIDACGHRSPFPGWLGEHGIEIPTDIAETGILYFTRHYGLRPGQEEPPRGRLPGNGDLGYIKWAIFPADNGCFSITLAMPEYETELRREITKPETFDLVCSQLLGVDQWTAPRRAKPRSKVFGMGELRSEWRNYLNEHGRPRVLGLFPVGDSLLRSNPLYGRGCSSGVVEAHLLAQALGEIQDLAVDPTATPQIPTPCAAPQTTVRYLELVEHEIRPHFESMRRQDQAAVRRAARQRMPGYKPSFKERLGKIFLEGMLRPALRGDMEVLRAFLPGFHMLAPPDLWLKNRATWLRMLKIWLRGKKRNTALGLVLARIGPPRKEMFELLGLELAGLELAGLEAKPMKTSP